MRYLIPISFRFQDERDTLFLLFLLYPIGVVLRSQLFPKPHVLCPARETNPAPPGRLGGNMRSQARISSANATNDCLETNKKPGREAQRSQSFAQLLFIHNYTPHDTAQRTNERTRNGPKKMRDRIGEIKQLLLTQLARQQKTHPEKNESFCARLLRCKLDRLDNPLGKLETIIIIIAVRHRDRVWLTNKLIYPTARRVFGFGCASPAVSRPIARKRSLINYALI